MRARRRPLRRSPLHRWALVWLALAPLLLAALPLAVAPQPAGFPGRVPGPSMPSVVVAPAYVPGPGIVDLGPLPAGSSVSVAVGLAPSDPVALDAAVALRSTPGTPQYGHPMTPSQVAAEFGPSAASYAAAYAYFTEQGLSVRTSPDRWMLLVSGPSSTVADAFGTSFESYRGPDRAFFAHPLPATLPKVAPWSGVFGLGNVSIPRPHLGTFVPAAPAPAASCVVTSPLPPCAVQSAYNVSSLVSAGSNGTGYRVAVVDVYDAGEPQSQLSSDLTTFASDYSLNAGPVSWVYPVPTSRNLNTTYTGWSSEEALDLEWARAAAPGASLQMTFSPDPTTGLYYSVDWLVAHQATDVISLSWGEPDVGQFNPMSAACSSECNASTDGSYTILHPVLAAAALEGISVLAASGDCGAAFGTLGVSTSYPASDPAVTGVGGTDLTLSSGKYGSETAWSGNASGSSPFGCQNQGGSGGGYSPFPRPAWQSAPGVPATMTVRGVPDVSLIGGTAVAVVIGGGTAGLLGTSVSTPIYAGFAAIADQLHGSPLGFLNPGLYQQARGASASREFHDITSGGNGYSTHSGWDPVTGIGSPVGNLLFPNLAGGVGAWSPLQAGVSANPRYTSVGTSVNFSASVFNSTSSVFTYDIDFGDGNASWTASGTAVHTFQRTGVFLARSTVFLTDGNSSTSLPVVVVIGGGHGLNVTLVTNTTAPPAGAPVTFSAVVSGGTTPYRYSFSFGDGTYLENSSRGSVGHAYALAGGYCASVVASDRSSPINAGGSTRVAISVGGAAGPDCHNPSSLVVNFSSTVLSADLPGDLPFSFSASGGTAPYSVQYVSDDPYVTACSCGLFSTPGPHLVEAFINDSLTESTVAFLNVTLYPALVGTFTASPMVGPVPLSVTLSANLSGGHLADAAATNWTFGDGSPGATGASVVHAYSSAGVFLSQGYASDGGGGRASVAFLVDALPTSPSTALGISATVTPANRSSAGTLLHFQAAANGGTPAYQYHWAFGSNFTAFGSLVNESFPPTSCVGCRIPIDLSVTDSTGVTIFVSFAIDDPGTARASALLLSESLQPVAGSTPLFVRGVATVAGMPSVQVSWTFGTGLIYSGTSASLYYLNPGNYTVTVTASDPFGDLIVHHHTVVVSGPARVAPTFSGGPTSSAGVAPSNVTFVVVPTGGSGPPYSAAWQFGDASLGSGLSTTHLYTSPGNFTANVTVTDAVGTPALSSYSIQVYNVTPVLWSARVQGSGSNVTAGLAFQLLLSATPDCGVFAVPSCGVGTIPASLRWANASVVSLDVPRGGALQSLTAPASPGNYTLTISSVGPNYTGSLSLTITIHALVVPVIGPPPGWRVDFLLLAVGLAVAAVALGLGYLVARRRRRRLSP